jgi:hypothetical protein
MEMSQNMKRGTQIVQSNDAAQRLLGPHPQAPACMSHEAGMQPSRHNCACAAIGQFDASTSDDPERGLGLDAPRPAKRTANFPSLAETTGRIFNAHHINCGAHIIF